MKIHLLVLGLLFSPLIYGQVALEDFESMAVSESVSTQTGWSISVGSASASDLEWAGLGGSGKSIQIASGSPRGEIVRTVQPAEWGSDTIAWWDFFILPIAHDGSSSVYTVIADEAKIEFYLSGGVGEIRVVNGDGVGGGTSEILSTTFSVSGYAANSWIQLTIRHDFTLDVWDLFVNGETTPSAANLGLASSLSEPSSITILGDANSPIYLDRVELAIDNPLAASNLNYTDADNDGMDDTWETAHGLSATLNDRDLDLDMDGVTNLAELMNSTDPSDYYDGTLPTLTIYSGDSQTGAAGQYFQFPLVVEAENQSQALENAPLLITASSLTSFVAEDSVGTNEGSSLSLLTDSSGLASTFFKAGSEDLGNQTVTAEATSGQSSTSVSFSLFIEPATDDMILWLKADSGVTLDSGEVSAWADQSGNSNDATNSTVGTRPVQSTNQLNGYPVINFSGNNKALSIATNALTSLTEADIFIVLKTASDLSGSWQGFWNLSSGSSQAHYPYFGAVYDGAGSSVRYALGTPGVSLHEFHIYNVSANSTEWIARFNDSVQFTNGSNTVSFLANATIGHATYNWDGDVAEIIIFDKVLSASERTAVNKYLNDKYWPPVAPVSPQSVTAQRLGDSGIRLDWSSSNSSESSISTLVERREVGGAYTLLTTVSQVENFLDTTVSDGITYEYRLREYNGTSYSNYSSQVLVTYSVPEIFTLTSADITLLLEGDNGPTFDSGSILTWEDQSGNGNDAIAPSAAASPAVVVDAINSKDVVRFDGSNDQLSLPSNALTSLTEAEVFVVLKVNGDFTGSFQGFWNLSAGTAQSHYPYQGGLYDGTGSNTRYTLGTPLLDINFYHVYNVTSDSMQWVARLNNSVQYTNGTNTVSFNSAPTLGRNNYYWSGDFAEVIIFDQALTMTERDDVYDYLNLKYSIEDLDLDGMPNDWELLYGLDPNDPADASLDADSDGLTNLQEYIVGTDPMDIDTDNNGTLDDMEDADSDSLPNLWEFTYQFNANDPSNPDTNLDVDSDDLTNLQEYHISTNPILADTDLDGTPDGLEDNDNDGIPNGWELLYGLNPNQSNDDNDQDSDGLTDYEEYLISTSPLLIDTDGDGVPDEWEQIMGLNPIVSDTINLDGDADGMLLLEEHQLGKNRLLQDNPVVELAIFSSIE